MSFKTCLTCNVKLQLDPDYKKQCINCYKNRYTICYVCKKKKSNSYALCFACNKLDKHDRLVHTVNNSFDLDYDLNFHSRICEHCEYEKTFQQQKYCLTCYKCFYS